MKKEDINRRFLTAVESILEKKGLKKTTLAGILGMKPSTFSEILNNRSNVGTETLAQVCDLYDVDPMYLLTGQGTMFRQESIPVAHKATKMGEGIPLIPLDAMAGSLTSEQTVLDYECERYVVPVFRGADFLMPVKGASMLPNYSSGDIVACQRVPMNDLFFQWNKVYVLDTSQGPLIKRVEPGEDREHVLLISDNEKYKPFSVPVSIIRGVALVIGTIRLE